MSGPTGSEQWMYSSGSGDFYSHTISQSLRFNNDDTPRLSRTWGAAATDDTTWTVSMWVKRASQDGGGWHTLFAEESQAWTVCAFYNDTLYVQINASGSAHYIQTNRVYRDFSAWYHIVVAFDEDNSTAAHRLRLYVNGVEETSFATDQRSSISSSSNSNWNTNGKSCAIGARSATNNSLNFDGYIAEFHNVDGQQLTPSSFGELKDGSVWIPKAYSGSHGDNGFYLPFDDSSAIGDDESANTNDWTATNLAATDVVLDSPTNKFSVMNPLFPGNSAVLSEGNLKVATGGFSSSLYGSISTMAVPRDKKIYIEVEDTAATGDNFAAGFATAAALNVAVGGTAVGGDGTIAIYNRSAQINGSETDYGSSAGLGGLGVAKLAAGDILGCMVDGATGKVWFSRNGTYFKSPSTDNSGTTGDPAGGSHEIGTLTGGSTDDIFFYVIGGTSADNIFINFGQDSTNVASANADGNGIGTFEYAPPNGFLCLCSSNMSDITIGPGQDTQADDHFSTVIYSGTGSNISVSVGFSPAWVWLKSRSLGYDNMIFDTLRGTNKILKSNSNTAEITTVTTSLLSFDSGGFTYGSEVSVNDSGSTNVSWNWKAGTTASGTESGSNPAYSSSSNPTAGFSIVAYTGTGSTGTVSHGCGAVPKAIFIKNRDAADNWAVYHAGTASDPATDYLVLNGTDAAADSANWWNDTAPTSSVFTVATDHSVNADGEKYVAYVFAEIEGFSAVGSFTGNGDDNGPVIVCGFTPTFVMVKRTDAANDWHIMDNKRNPINVMDGLLFANLTTGETSDASYNRDFLSNGFKIRGSEAYVNASGGTFIYLAFGSSFKFANAQ